MLGLLSTSFRTPGPQYPSIERTGRNSIVNIRFLSCFSVPSTDGLRHIRRKNSSNLPVKLRDMP